MLRVWVAETRDALEMAKEGGITIALKRASVFFIWHTAGKQKKV